MENTNTQEDIFIFLQEYKNWSYEGGQLKAEFSRDSFEQAIADINLVAAIATRLDHHPRIINEYDQLSFLLCTHSAEDKVTAKDIELAKEIDSLFK